MPCDDPVLVQGHSILQELLTAREMKIGMYRKATTRKQKTELVISLSRIQQLIDEIMLEICKYHTSRTE